MATVRINLRRDSAADWTSEDPTMTAGEIGFETDTNRFKVGDGSTVWSSLEYFVDETAIPTITTYTTGWVSAAAGLQNQNWTVTHGLTANISDLIINICISSDGTEANAIGLPQHTYSVSNHGMTIFQTSTAAFDIQTGSSGLTYLSDANGNVAAISANTWYYKVKVYYIQAP